MYRGLAYNDFGIVGKFHKTIKNEKNNIRIVSMNDVGVKISTVKPDAGSVSDKYLVA